MNTKIESYIQDKTETLEKVLTFHLLNSIKKYYGTVDNLKKANNKIKSDIQNHTVSNKELSHFNNCFYVSPDKISKIVGKIKNEKGKQIRKTKQVLDNLIKRNNIKILPNYTLRYNSGKIFSVKTRYILDYDYLDKVWDNEEVWNNKSSYYTKKEHKLIDKYILNYNKPTKTVKVSNTETQETTKDELKMKTIETEINDNKTNTESMTTKPDTQIIDMLNMMNNKINSLIKDNIELKKELDEIKSSLQHHTFTKYEDYVEDDEDTTQTEEENNNSDDIKITNSKELIIDIPSFKYEQCNAKFPFNESSKKVFVDKLKTAHNSKYITYSDYINFLTIMGVKVENLPNVPNYKKSSSRLSKYYNYFYDEFVKRGYNMFGMQAESDQSSMCFNSKESYETRNDIFKAYNNKFITYADMITFCKIFSNEPVNFADNNNKTRNPREYNKIYDKIKARDYDMLGMKRMDKDKVTRTSNKNVEKYDKKEYLTTFNRIFDEEVNHKFDYAGDDFCKMMINKDI